MASGLQATPSAAGQAGSCRGPEDTGLHGGGPGRGLSLRSGRLLSAPLVSPENVILQENVGQESKLT